MKSESTKGLVAARPATIPGTSALYKNPRQSAHKAGEDPPVAAPTDAGDDLIDVRALISSYDVGEHARRADDYFKNLTLKSAELRKPFMGHESPRLIGHLGTVVGELNFFPGMKVVDFGCGTGWLSQSLALIGCRPISVDVSQRALDLGKAFTAAKYPEIADEITYLRYDGSTIDLPDNSVDCVICMDSFHHVANQNRILSEFYRILVQDGRAIFCEPGPFHSRTAESQHVMRTFGVIENDIIIEDIWRMAQTHGFKDIKLIAFSLRNLELTLTELHSLKSFKEASGVLKRAFNEIYAPLYLGNRIFTLIKGQRQKDSRRPDGLAGEIIGHIEDAGKLYRISGVVRNAGTATWRPMTAGVGAVNIGLILRTAGGEWQMDFERIRFLASALEPGGERQFAATLAKDRVDSAEIYIDLLAEGVTWFNNYHPQRLILPNSESARTIPFALYRVTGAPPPGFCLSFGCPIDFSENGNSAFYTGSGWSHQEAAGRWTDGSIAALRVRLQGAANAEAQKRIYMDFRAAAFGGSQRVIVSVDGKQVSELQIVFERRDYKIAVDLDNPDPDLEHEIVFTLPDAHSPLSAGVSQDPRRLGISMSSLTFFDSARTPGKCS